MWETRNEFTPVESSFDVARGRGIRGGVVSCTMHVSIRSVDKSLFRSLIR